MSGITKSLGKVFGRSGGKVATGLLGAAAAYYLGGLVTGNYGSDAAVSDFNANANSGADVGGDPGMDVPTSDVSMPASDVTTPMPEAAPPVEAPPASPANAPQPQPQAQPSMGNAGGDNSQGALERKMSWLDSLSPEAREKITGGKPAGASNLAAMEALKGAATGALQGVAQRNNQQYMEEKEGRFREDRKRRGQVEAAPAGAFISGRGILDTYRRT